MAKERFLILWGVDPVPTRNLPAAKRLALFEKNVDLHKKGVRKGLIKDAGYFSLSEGFSIVEMEVGARPDPELMPPSGDAEHMHTEVKKIIPYDEGNELVRKNIHSHSDFDREKGER